MTSSSAIKTVGKRKEERDDWSDGFSVPKSLQVMEPDFPGDGLTLASLGSDERIPCFALPVRDFWFPY